MCFSGPLNKPTGNTARFPAPETQPGPLKVTVSLPSSDPSEVRFKSALRTICDAELSGNAVVTQVLPPSLSSFKPTVPASAQGNRPNGANAEPGSKYISLPFNFTSTTLVLRSRVLII